ncbi:MAG: alpha/beta fold hydrolase [Nevskia sp.]|nr:alpha/beta fold hydrolase [Nevskia sp.]
MTEAAIELRVDSGISLPGCGPLQVALDVRAPRQASLGAVPAVLVCLPGGAMNRRFFDLMPNGDAAGDISFSFARQMAGRGFIVVSIDHLGVGGSDRPEDGFALTPELVVQANQNALRQVLERLRGGGLLADLPPLPDLVAIGVGHSMGAMLTLLQQFHHRSYAGLALLGFSTRGMPEYLIPEAKALAGDTQAVRAQLARLAKATFGVPYPEVKPSPQSNSLFAGGAADPRGVEAIKAARDHMLALPAFMSMLPGNVAPEAAQIDVPLFLALGERDIAGPPHQIPAVFTASRDVSLHILPETGHSHFLFPARTGLFNRLAGWARLVAGGV